MESKSGEDPKTKFEKRGSDTFQRIEKKLWMTRTQYKAMLPVLERYMQKDQYGLSLICNIYYDTDDFSLIRRSIERPFFKEKLRVRSYGYPSEKSMVFVEIKRKLDGIGYKRRISLPFEEARRLLQGDESIRGSDPQIANEIREFIRRYRPKPKVDLTYQRQALYGKEDPDLRITLDSHLRYRTLNPEKPGEEGMLPIMKEDENILMEIKALCGLPDWLKEALSRLEIYQAPFSKIGTCYTRHIAPRRRYGESDKIVYFSQDSVKETGTEQEAIEKRGRNRIVRSKNDIEEIRTGEIIC